MRTFMHRLGIHRHKTRHIPVKADPARRAQYLEKAKARFIDKVGFATYLSGAVAKLALCT
jgi:hypothetical protein